MTEEVRVRFYPARVEGMVPKGSTIIEAARMLGVGLESPCNGTGKCAKDLVQVRTQETLKVQLACKTTIESDIEVTIPSREDNRLKVVEHFHSDSSFSAPASTLMPREAAPPSYGVALDIGTTTLVAALVDMFDGETIGSSSTLNPLVFYGHDVMSRIHYSVSHKDGLFTMHHELISAVNMLTDILAAEAGVRPEKICRLTAAGNTTMQHIFLNKKIAGLGEHPYQAEMLDAFTASAGELNIRIAELAPVTTFPCISAFVGGDIVSGLLALNLKGSETPALFLDIGTNGEMAIITDSGIVATSTAAGPCFEGMTISNGMRAALGAIEHVHFGKEVFLDVIGGERARGICGSGMLDLVAEMIEAEIINAQGRLQGADAPHVPEALRQRLSEREKRRYFRLTEDVTVSQEDIRQVQLARAAVRSGVEILLAECGIKPEQVKNVIIAGGFGYHLKEESLLTVGLIPKFPEAKLSYVGNSCLEGARRLLLDKELLDKSSAITGKAWVIELANLERFEASFVREMHFEVSPHVSCGIFSGVNIENS
ncbi:MAG: ASKHA domain-containing protein [Pseudomonadota bacterium]